MSWGTILTQISIVSMNRIFSRSFFTPSLFSRPELESVEIVRRPLIPVLSYLSVAVDKESELRLRVTSTTEKRLVKQKTLRINAFFM